MDQELARILAVRPDSARGWTQLHERASALRDRYLMKLRERLQPASGVIDAADGPLYARLRCRLRVLADHVTRRDSADWSRSHDFAYHDTRCRELVRQYNLPESLITERPKLPGPPPRADDVFACRPETLLAEQGRARSGTCRVVVARTVQRLLADARTHLRASNHVAARARLERAGALAPAAPAVQHERALHRATLGDRTGLVRELSAWRRLHGVESAELLEAEAQEVLSRHTLPKGPPAACGFEGTACCSGACASPLSCVDERCER